MRLTQLLLRRPFPKSSFRRPMDGRNLGKKKPVTMWSLSLGELDEEETVDGRSVPVRSKVPVIHVPDLKDFKLKAYVTYRAEDTHEPPMESKDFFNIFYAPEIEASDKNLTLETLPDETKSQPSFLGKIFSNRAKSS